MTNLDKVEKITQVIINGQIPEKLGTKIKLNKTEEFKGLNVTDIIKKAKELQQKEDSDTSH
jgi:hypothetical protein